MNQIRGGMSPIFLSPRKARVPKVELEPSPSFGYWIIELCRALFKKPTLKSSTILYFFPITQLRHNQAYTSD